MTSGSVGIGDVGIWWYDPEVTEVISKNFINKKYIKNIKENREVVTVGQRSRN